LKGHFHEYSLWDYPISYSRLGPNYGHAHPFLIFQIAHWLATIFYVRGLTVKNWYLLWVYRKFLQIFAKMYDFIHFFSTSINALIHCRVGWFWTFFTFSTKVPLRFVIYLPKVPKIAKKMFGPSNRFIIGHDFLGHALYKGPKFVFHNMDFMGTKRCRILRRFQKYKLTLVTKCT
jgi:hypothetical protein